MKYLLIFLRIHGLLPPKKINKAGFSDTLRIMCLAFPPWIVLFTSIAYAYVNFKTASLADITDVMCTNFICLIVVNSNAILAVKKFKIRAVVTEMREMVQKRNVKFCNTFCVCVCVRRSIFIIFHSFIRSFPSSHDPTIYIVTKYHLFCRKSCWTLSKPTL